MSRVLFFEVFTDPLWMWSGEGVEIASFSCVDVNCKGSVVEECSLWSWADAARIRPVGKALECHVTVS